MKLIINYDFIETVRNVKEPITPFKVIRNNKKKWATFNFPLYMAINAAIQKDLNIPLTVGSFVVFCYIVSLSETLVSKMFSTDIYEEEAQEKIKRLLPQLNDLNISTDYDLLLESELYERKYKIQINENKIPELIESKYILVPTYTYKNEIKETSILQEHVVGSKTYVLSLGSPSKQFKLAYSGI